MLRLRSSLGDGSFYDGERDMSLTRVWAEIDGIDCEVDCVYEPWRPATFHRPAEGEFWIETVWVGTEERRDLALMIDGALEDKIFRLCKEENRR